jgi:hypothetical protein
MGFRSWRCRPETQRSGIEGLELRIISRDDERLFGAPSAKKVEDLRCCGESHGTLLCALSRDRDAPTLRVLERNQEDHRPLTRTSFDISHALALQ